MIRLSSRRALIVKWVTPALITAGTLVYAAVEWTRQRQAAVFLLVTLVVAAVAFFTGRRSAGRLADTVLDGGDHIVVIRNGLVERVALSEIVEVSLVDEPMGTSVIVLRLATPHRIGSEVVLAPIDNTDPLGWWRSRIPASALADDLRPGLIEGGLSFTAKRVLAGIAAALLLFSLADQFLLHVFPGSQGRTLHVVACLVMGGVLLWFRPTAAQWRAHRLRQRSRAGS